MPKGENASIPSSTSGSLNPHGPGVQKTPKERPVSMAKYNQHIIWHDTAVVQEAGENTA